MIWTSAAPLFSLHQTLDRHKIFVVETIAGLGSDEPGWRWVHWEERDEVGKGSKAVLKTTQPGERELAS